MAHDNQATEPRTPLWLPALGIALFVSAAVFWAITPPFARADIAAPGANAHADAGPADASSGG